MSFADFVMSARMASETVISSPGSRSSLEGATEAAASEIEILSDILSRPDLDRLERQVERHHLGERGRVANLIAVVVVQNGARVGVDDHRGMALGPSLRALRN